MTYHSPDDSPSMHAELEYVTPSADPDMTLAEAKADAAYPFDAPHVCPACWNTPLTGCDEHRGAAAEDHAQDLADQRWKGER